ncbi:hypothetical protein PCL_01279 [Purpureocillium lilacinum]|uniref:Uncharacterized protein n=1 Tax=Purpureocillium lilacinum TaxID=33203 RepID=A0A2U3E344_PURLI|nr:hypothetical protein PCL_01279 [Purpureocillium lilacinum]
MLGLGWAGLDRPQPRAASISHPSKPAGVGGGAPGNGRAGKAKQAAGSPPMRSHPSYFGLSDLPEVRLPPPTQCAPPGRNRRAAGSANTHSSVSSPMAWGSRACPSHDTTLPTITTSSPWPLPSPPVVRHFCSIAPGTRSPAEAQQRSLSRRHLLRQRPLPTALSRGPLFASAHLKGAVQFSASQSLPTVTCGIAARRRHFVQRDDTGRPQASHTLIVLYTLGATGVQTENIPVPVPPVTYLLGPLTQAIGFPRLSESISHAHAHNTTCWNTQPGVCAAAAAAAARAGKSPSWARRARVTRQQQQRHSYLRTPLPSPPIHMLSGQTDRQTDRQTAQGKAHTVVSPGKAAHGLRHGAAAAAAAGVVSSPPAAPAAPASGLPPELAQGGRGSERRSARKLVSSRRVIQCRSCLVPSITKKKRASQRRRSSPGAAEARSPLKTPGNNSNLPNGKPRRLISSWYLPAGRHDPGTRRLNATKEANQLTLRSSESPRNASRGHCPSPYAMAGPQKKNTTDLNAGPFHHPSSGLDPADQIQQRRVCPEGERSMKEERDEERGMMLW